MAWPRDDAKLERVRALMAEEELDALVVRAPDNVLYLTNFWGMKGYDAVVFPREGEPVLIASSRPRRTPRARPGPTTSASFRGYDDDDPRPPLARDARRWRARPQRDYGAIGLELSARHAGLRPDGRRADDVHAGLVRRVRPDVADATPLLARARALKTEQELERMRLANEIAAAAMEHVARELRPGMKESEAGRALAGLRPRRGHRLEGQGRARARLLARLVRARDPDVHRHRGPARCRRTSRRCSRSGSAPTATGATTRRTSARASCAPTYEELRAAAARRLRARARPLPSGREPRRARPPHPRGHRRRGLSRPADASDRARRRRARARAALRAPGRRRRRSRRGWCSRSSPASTGKAAAACASRTTSSSPRTASRSSRRSRTDVVVR